MLDKSQIEALVPCKELVFPDSFQLYKAHFAEEALKHPAKCNLYLLSYLIQNHTVQGDTILDCCAGTGSTAFIAGLYGRKSILLEVEPRYVRWMTKTFKGKPFSPTILCGDSRKLREGLAKIGNPEVSVIITSPPYADMLKGVEMLKGGYSYSQAQVGRLALPQHLAEVEKIYRECYAVLPNGQKLILIVRNYNRKGSVVDYTHETCQLCNAIGFRIVEAFKFRLPKIRAELINYYKAHPLTPRILHEYVLVFEKAEP